MKLLKNRRGQSLIEYLVLVALMGVASISVVKLMSHTLNAKFGQVVNALNGGSEAESKIKTDSLKESHYSQKSLGDFFEGSGKR
jgi:pilus assembly protein Flp/PilA